MFILSRRLFVARTSALGAIALALPAPAQPAAATQPEAKPTPAPKPPPLPLETVQTFVRAAHTDLDKTKSMLTEQPRLINATWDWGNGDFETALGGASHMGRPDIANYLLDNGARMDLFAAATLGRLDIIKPALTAYPRFLDTPGPHGIPLIAHAEKGGDPAKEVLEYLKSLKPAGG